MPTPDRTSVADIVAAARDILESTGLPGLTMAAVAARVGVRAPSLYKRVGSRDELVGLVADATVQDLGDRLQQLDRAAGGQSGGGPEGACSRIPGLRPATTGGLHAHFRARPRRRTPPHRDAHQGDRHPGRCDRSRGRPAARPRRGTPAHGLGERVSQHGAQRRLPDGRRRRSSLRVRARAADRGTPWATARSVTRARGTLSLPVTF